MRQKEPSCKFCCLVAKSHLTLAIPWAAAHQAPLCMGLLRQECWSGAPFPSPGEGTLPDPGIKPVSPALTGRLFTVSNQGSPVACAPILEKQQHRPVREASPQAKGAVNQRLLSLNGPHRLGKQGRERIRNGDMSQGEKYLSQGSR